MPHKIKENMAVYPTRYFMVEDMLRIYTYHYKLRKDQARLNAEYKLGDRKVPSKNRYRNLKKITEKYPNIISRYVNE